ncbi:MAG: long-chain-fatty-acid--CoA ligase [Planctomycetota bacterium]|nr:MAG: long-chain-fatty-acid--CoA ligase [Planctomycetota bacterium]
MTGGGARAVPVDTLLTRLDTHARERPDALLLRGPWGALTAIELAAGVARAEHWLLERGLGAAGAQTADADLPARLGLCLEKGAAFVLLHLAALRRGLVILPLNPRAPASERDALLAEAGAATLVLDDTLPAGAPDCAVHRLPTDELFDALAGAAPAPHDRNAAAERAHAAHAPPSEAQAAVTPLPTADAPAVMLATSGTTGRPKLAVHTHTSLAANQRALQTAWRWSADDALLHVLPHFHVHGLFVALHGALWAGAETHFARRFDSDDVWAELAAGRVSVFMSVPTMVHRMLAGAAGASPGNASRGSATVEEGAQAAGASRRHARQVGRLRLMTCGSAPLSLEDRAAFVERCGVSIVERYGMTETGILTSQSLDAPRDAGGVGDALPGVELRVASSSTHVALPLGEEGEVQVRGDSLFAGYWQRPEADAELFTPDGWLRTGDLGALSPSGELTLLGRSKDLVISGGFNVHPREVELVLEQHAAVDQAAVLGVADADFGERVIAAVVLASSASPSETLARTLIAHCRAQLAAYKCPKRVLFREQLPRNAMGKLMKVALKRELRLS